MVFEDIDRSPLFSADLDMNWRGRPRINKNDKTTDSAVTMPSLLNLIDGVVEANSRILIMTANDISVLTSDANKAVVRPGRIDKQVEIRNCDNEQTRQMFSLFFTGENLELDKIKLSKPITSAELINLFMRYELVPDKVKRFLYGLPPLDGEVDLSVPEPVDMKTVQFQEKMSLKLGKCNAQACGAHIRLRREKNALRRFEKTLTNADKTKAKMLKQIEKWKKKADKLTESKKKVVKELVIECKKRKIPVPTRSKSVRRKRGY